MSNYKTPGVYITEISTLPSSIASVETAIPAFIGYTAIAEKDGESLSMVPTRISSMLEYESYFGGPNNETIIIDINDTYDGQDTQPAVMIDRKVTVSHPATISDYKMYYSMRLFFANGGGPCYIISVGTYLNAVEPGSYAPPTNLLGGLSILEKVDEPTLIVFSDYMGMNVYAGVYNAALAQCEKLKDRFVIMDLKGGSGDPFEDANDFRNDGVGMSNLKYGAVYYPDLKSALNYGYNPSIQANITNSYIGSGTPTGLPADSTRALDSLESSDPPLFRSIIAEIRKLYIDVPASGAVAGVFARVDSQRGVWKAPANVDIRGIIGPVFKISHDEQANLNVDPSTGKSINVIRTFTGKGTLIWGARTLAGNDNEWRYVHVRRLFIFIEESIKKATEFVVFEPNDANTWLRVKTMIENFLTGLWRDGALAGAKPDDAFFVNIGLGITMSPIDILEGRLIVEIGIAAVRPAEFIILKFSHKLQES